MSSTRRKSGYDLTIIPSGSTYGIGLMYYRDPDRKASGGVGKGGARLAATHAPVNADERFQTRDVPVVWDTWHRGAGYSQRLVPGTYADGRGLWARSPRVAMPAGALTEVTLPPGIGEITGSAEVDGHLYFCGGPLVTRLDNGTGAPSAHAALPSFTALSMVNWGGNLYVGGTGGGIWQRNGSSGVWAQSADVRRKYLAMVVWTKNNVSRVRMAGSSLGGAVAYTWPESSILYTDAIDPMLEANWSSEIQVGNPGYYITNLVASNNHLFILKRNGLHDMDDRGWASNMTAWMEHNLAPVPQTKWPAVIDGGHAYYGHPRGLARVNLADDRRQDRPEWCGFGYGLPYEGAMQGSPTALCSHDGWVLSGLYSGATGYLAAGGDRTGLGIDGIGPVLWHGSEIPALPGERITWLHPTISSADNKPRLWIASITNAGAVKLRWQSLPVYGSPLADLLNGGGMTFQESWTLNQPIEDWSEAGGVTAKKWLRRWDVRVDGINAASSAYLDVYAHANAAASAIPGDHQGRLNEDASPRASFLSSVPEAYDVGTTIVGTGSSTNPVRLRSLKARAGIVLEQAKTIRFTCAVGESVLNWNGARDTDDTRIKLEVLEALQEESSVTLIDEHGYEYSVRIEQGISEQMIEDPESHSWVTVVTFDATILSSYFVWDDGHLYDQSGAVVYG